MDEHGEMKNDAMSIAAVVMYVKEQTRTKRAFGTTYAKYGPTWPVIFGTNCKAYVS